MQLFFISLISANHLCDLFISFPLTLVNVSAHYDTTPCEIVGVCVWRASTACVCDECV